MSGQVQCPLELLLQSVCILEHASSLAEEETLITGPSDPQQDSERAPAGGLLRTFPDLQIVKDLLFNRAVVRATGAASAATGSTEAAPMES